MRKLALGMAVAASAFTAPAIARDGQGYFGGDAGIVSAILFLALKYTVGLRPSAEVETEGLDINEHGERAYNM